MNKCKKVILGVALACLVVPVAVLLSACGDKVAPSPENILSDTQVHVKILKEYHDTLRGEWKVTGTYGTDMVALIDSHWVFYRPTTPFTSEALYTKDFGEGVNYVTSYANSNGMCVLNYSDDYASPITLGVVLSSLPNALSQLSFLMEFSNDNNTLVLSSTDAIGPKIIVFSRII